MKRIVIAALAALAFLSPATASDLTAKWGKVGNWTIVGNESGCHALGYWQTTIGMIQFDNINQRFDLGFADGRWKEFFPAHGAYPVRLVFSNGQWGDFVATTTDAAGVLGITDVNVATVDYFMAAQSLQIYSNGRPLAWLDLTGSRQATQEAALCAKTMREARTS